MARCRTTGTATGKKRMLLFNWLTKRSSQGQWPRSPLPWASTLDFAWPRSPAQWPTTDQIGRFRFDLDNEPPSTQRVGAGSIPQAYRILRGPNFKVRTS